MHCLKCRESLPADDLRFCRFCGFDLKSVNQSLACQSGDLKADKAHSRQLLFKQVMLCAVILSMLLFINIALRGLISLQLSHTIEMTGIIVALLLTRLIWPYLFHTRSLNQGGRKLPKEQTNENLLSAQEYVSLEPTFNPAEQMQPSSVTERTTNPMENGRD
jgi:hypothetical protein